MKSLINSAFIFIALISSKLALAGNGMNGLPMIPSQSVPTLSTYGLASLVVAFGIVILSFITSCFITANLVSHFISDEIIYTGVVFSILASLLQAVVVLLYLIVFYGFFNP